MTRKALRSMSRERGSAFSLPCCHPPPETLVSWRLALVRWFSPSLVEALPPSSGWDSFFFPFSIPSLSHLLCYLTSTPPHLLPKPHRISYAPPSPILPSHCPSIFLERFCHLKPKPQCHSHRVLAVSTDLSDGIYASSVQKSLYLPSCGYVRLQLGALWSDWFNVSTPLMATFRRRSPLPPAALPGKFLQTLAITLSPSATSSKRPPPEPPPLVVTSWGVLPSTPFADLNRGHFPCFCVTENPPSNLCPIRPPPKPTWFESRSSATFSDSSANIWLLLGVLCLIKGSVCSNIFWFRVASWVALILNMEHWTFSFRTLYVFALMVIYNFRYPLLY